MMINWVGVVLCTLAVFVIGGAAVAGVIAAIGLGMIIGPAPDLMRGLHFGLIAGICLVTMSFVINYLFANRSMALLLIDGGYNIVLFAAMGAIYGVLG